MRYAGGLGSDLSGHVLDKDLHAYMDNQLASDRRPAVECYLRDNAEPARRVGSYIAQREALRAAPEGVKSEPIPPWLDPHLLQRHRHSERRNIWRAAAAAHLVIGIGGTIDWMTNGALIYDHLNQHQTDVFGRQAAAAYLGAGTDQPGETTGRLAQRDVGECLEDARLIHSSGDAGHGNSLNAL